MGQRRVGDVVGPPAPKLAPQREPVVYEPPPPGTLGALAALKRQQQAPAPEPELGFTPDVYAPPPGLSEDLDARARTQTDPQMVQILQALQAAVGAR